jgi:hypothetical protein
MDSPKAAMAAFLPPLLLYADVFDFTAKQFPSISCHKAY